MRRITEYDYGRRENGPIHKLHCDWTSDIISADGANYHLWIPHGLTKEAEKQCFEDFKRAARNHGDPVTFSWDYIPEEKL